MNFEIITNSRFKIGLDFYQRLYQVKVKANGLLQLVNIQNRKILFDNLNLADLTVNGLPATLKNLQDVIYNFDCACDPSFDDSLYKIFDLSFDNTFE